MSLLINGKLQNNWFDEETRDGEFKRMESTFRNWITADGAPGPSGTGSFVAEPDRYHLYVSLACPWAHRTLIFRTLKKLERIISVSVVHPFMGEPGWHFETYPGATLDTVNNKAFMHEVYTLARADFTGLVTVPVLWDKKLNTIVNNESSEIIRMFNTAFNAYTNVKTDYYPEHLRAEIDAINKPIYDYVNNGVYRCGFATSQRAYDHAFDKLFSTLDMLEQRLATQRYLVGNEITEADWRLFTTLVRFDPVYVTHFKCNLRRLNEYANITNYLRELYQLPGIAETFNLDHIKRHYYTSHEALNPSGIIPKGFAIDYAASHNRTTLS